MADVPGQAVTQPALGELTPAQEVEHLEAAITPHFVEKPRDEQGKFVAKEPPAAEPDKPAAPAEAATEELAPEEEKPEITPEPRRFKLNYKGEEKEIDEPEAIELAQKGYDYTQKTQALSKEREEMSAKAKTDQEAAVKKYEDQLEVHRQAVLRLADPEVLNADLNTLAQTDPAKALQLMLKRNQVIQAINGITVEQQRIANQRESEAQTAKAKQAGEALETIQRDIPGWNHELYGKILKTAVDTGFTQNEANAITDPKVVKLLNDARQWREYVAAKPHTVDKRVALVPKVTKPGTVEKSNPNAERFQKSMDRLSKTGARDDAVSLVQQMIDSGRL